MYMKIKKNWSFVLEIVIDCLLLIAGILCCVSGNFSERFLTISLGVLMVVYGLGTLFFQYILHFASIVKTTSGLLSIAFGIIVCCNFPAVNLFLIIVFGIICTLLAFNYFIRTWTVYRVGLGPKIYIDLLVRAVIYLTLAILSFVDAGTSFVIISVIVGAGIIYIAITRFIDFYLNKIKHQETYEFDFTKKHKKNNDVEEDKVEEQEEKKDEHIVDVDVKED